MIPEARDVVLTASIGTRLGRGRAAVTLFVATTFTGSALLFVVQPLFAKMALPELGGSPAVWNTCVLFFQTVLLLAYLYAHLTVRWLGPRKQAISHIALLLLPLLVLPVAVPAGGPSPGENPTWWLLRMMTVRVGLPFFLVATMAPLVQRWFAILPLRSAADPYFLYAASNLGSMLALLAFPFVLEPAFGVRSQALGWVGGYLLLIALAAACAAVTWRYGSALVQAASGLRAAVPITWPQRSWWILLAFVPSSLMLGVTTHISTDLAAVPLLWIVPLALYLATFILAFSAPEWFRSGFWARAFPLLALTAVASVVFRVSSPFLIVLHLAAFFAAGIVCHARLARSRPPAVHLTEFYLWLSVGGVLGGIFNTLIAPVMFDGVYEYPLVLAVGCLLRPAAPSKKASEPWPVFAISAVVPLLVFSAAWFAGLTPPEVSLSQLLVIGTVVSGTFWTFSRRRAPANAVVIVLISLLLAGFGRLPGNVMFSDRSFFGVLKVIERPEPGYHVLQHGTTLHGRQNLRASASCEPLAYYHRSGPIGQLFAASGSRFRQVAVIGLGTGALACYSEAGQRMTFLEIDPMMQRVAQDPRLFTYLQNSDGGIDINIGDGRKLLEGTPAASYDLIIVDAFSSDSVPVHLLTVEALRTYFARLRPEGLLAFHISNRYLDLESVLAATAQAEGFFAVVNRDTNSSDATKDPGRSPSHWVLISRHETELKTMRDRPGWRVLSETNSARPWTDDYSNILDVLLLGRR